MELVAEVFHVPEFQITDIKCLKSGMTNKSFLFRTGDHHCICRIPGPGTELLINREQEKKFMMPSVLWALQNMCCI